MSHLNMAAMNGANGSIGTLPLMNNGPNGATPRHGGETDDSDFEGRLNSTIYDYFVKRGNFECARALMKSEARFTPPLRAIDGDVNGTDEDSKDDMGSKRPSDLPPPSDPSPGSLFLLEWFSLFWDVWNAQRKKPSASTQAMSYVQHTQAQTRLRQEQQRQLLQTGMPNIMPGDYQMMRMQNGMPMPDNLRAKAMQNRGNAFAQATPQQIAHMKQQHQLMQQQMRRDPSDMDVNGQRARTPSSGDNAPSPSKRPRIEGVPFNAQQMMQNNRAPMQSMQGQPMMDPAMNPANQMLINSGIDPETLSTTQYSTFSQQPQNVQAKSIQAMSQRLQGGARPGPRPGMPGQGSPMVPTGYDLGTGVPEFMNNPAMMRGGVPPGTANNGNHALQDYQMQLMLLEQQNKKRLLMARQEQDTMRQPDGQQMPGGPGYAPGMSPSGSRSGPSPGPNDQMGKRSPKMGPGGLPGSPMPDGTMAQARGSPMSFNGQVPAEMYQVRGMENGIGPAGPNAMRMQPGSHPAQIAGGGFNPPQAAQQHTEAMRAQAARMPNGQQWQQAPPPGQAPVMQPNQGQQPAQMGTPQQRNAMPPPQAVPTGTGANGARPSSPAQGAPPTPQPANKANPKGKKDTKETRKRPKKASTASVTATPAGEQEAHTPTPATPIIAQHPNSFAAGQKSEAPNPASIPQGPAPAAPAPGLALPQADVNMAPQFGALEGAEGQFNIGPFSGLDGGDVLDNFDFDSFLHDDGGFEFDASNFNMGGGDGVEAGAEGA